MPRTRRASVAWLHEQHVRGTIDFDYVSTDGMAADTFTKSTRVLAKRIEARKLINVFASADELMSRVTSKRSGHQVTAVACLCSQSLARMLFVSRVRVIARFLPPSVTVIATWRRESRNCG